MRIKPSILTIVLACLAIILFIIALNFQLFSETKAEECETENAVLLPANYACLSEEYDYQNKGISTGFDSVILLILSIVSYKIDTLRKKR